uniref:DUF4278 domain-containing protein n=1 Tax=Prochlorococcus marinus str. P0902-H212 TaxID=1620696 RepID=A0A0D5A1Q3_PROMR|nr:hypothetical protein FA02_0189 [Prochlorococcus marinus str. P0902-H212]
MRTLTYRGNEYTSTKIVTSKFKTFDSSMMPMIWRGVKYRQ